MVECRESVRDLLRFFGHAPLLHLEGVIWVKMSGERGDPTSVKDQRVMRLGLQHGTYCLLVNLAETVAVDGVAAVKRGSCGGRLVDVWCTNGEMYGVY